MGDISADIRQAYRDLVRLQDAYVTLDIILEEGCTFEQLKSFIDNKPDPKNKYDLKEIEDKSYALNIEAKNDVHGFLYKCRSKNPIKSFSLNASNLPADKSKEIDTTYIEVMKRKE